MGCAHHRGWMSHDWGGGPGKLAHHAGLQGLAPSMVAQAVGLTEQSKVLTSSKVHQFPSMYTAFIKCTEKHWKWVKGRGDDIISQKGVCVLTVNQFSFRTPPITKQP